MSDTKGTPPQMSLAQLQHGLEGRLTLIEKAARVARENLALVLHLKANAGNHRLMTPGNTITVATPQGPREVSRGEAMEMTAANCFRQAVQALADAMVYAGDLSEMVPLFFNAHGVKVQ